MTIWQPTSECLSKVIGIKMNVYPQSRVHCGIVYNSQDMEANGWTDREVV